VRAALRWSCAWPPGLHHDLHVGQLKTIRYGALLASREEGWTTCPASPSRPCSRPRIRNRGHRTARSSGRGRAAPHTRRRQRRGHHRDRRSPRGNPQLGLNTSRGPGYAPRPLAREGCGRVRVQADPPTRANACVPRSVIRRRNRDQDLVGFNDGGQPVRDHSEVRRPAPYQRKLGGDLRLESRARRPSSHPTTERGLSSRRATDDALLLAAGQP